MAYRLELRKYIGHKIGFTARMISRSHGGQYGFLLTDVEIPEGGKIDHIWLRLYWDELAVVSGHVIRGLAHVDTYQKACRIEGRYIADGETGIGFSDLDAVEVLMGDEWTPLSVAATKIRKSRIAKIKQAKLDGTYVYPGKWTYATGSFLVKAAKSATAGSKCDVQARDPQYSRDVILTEQVAPGVWKFSEVKSESAAA